MYIHAQACNAGCVRRPPDAGLRKIFVSVGMVREPMRPGNPGRGFFCAIGMVKDVRAARGGSALGGWLGVATGVK